MTDTNKSPVSFVIDSDVSLRMHVRFAADIHVEVIIFGQRHTIAFVFLEVAVIFLIANLPLVDASF